jgi:hypothetical protein
LCGTAADGLAQTIQQTQDILDDGSNRLGPSCDAISIGIGFNAVQIANPTKVIPDPVAPPDPCSPVLDAGTDAPSDATLDASDADAD